MKDRLLNIATRLDQIQWSLRYGDPEDEDELEVYANDIQLITHELMALADNVEQQQKG